jgi:hypothetical protein
MRMEIAVAAGISCGSCGFSELLMVKVVFVVVQHHDGAIYCFFNLGGVGSSRGVQLANAAASAVRTSHGPGRCRQ